MVLHFILHQISVPLLTIFFVYTETVAVIVVMTVTVVIHYIRFDFVDSVLLSKMLCVFPNAAMAFGFDRIQFAETHGTMDDFITFAFSVTLHQLIHTSIRVGRYLGVVDLFDSGSLTVSLGFSFVMLLVDGVLYLFLATFISWIQSGKFKEVRIARILYVSTNRFSPSFGPRNVHYNYSLLILHYYSLRMCFHSS